MGRTEEVEDEGEKDGLDDGLACCRVHDGEGVRVDL
jgi:hypothetical protein